MGELAVVVEELTDVSAAARADVDRHLAAREAAEEALAAERARAADLEEEVATLRAELEALHAAHDRTLGAEERMRAARAAELGALRASSERLRPIKPGEEATLDLAVELARAAQRLRSARTPDEADAISGSEDVIAGEAVVDAPAVVPAGADPVSALAGAGHQCRACRAGVRRARADVVFTRRGRPAARGPLGRRARPPAPPLRAAARPRPAASGRPRNVRTIVSGRPPSTPSRRRIVVTRGTRCAHTDRSAPPPILGVL